MSQKEGMVTYLRKTCRAGNPCSILIIEDDDLIVQTISQAANVFEPGCFDIEQVKTLESVGAKFAGIIYDLVVVDLGLVESGGYATFQVVRDIVNGRAPIAVLTATDDEELELRCLVEGGAVAYVVKPIVNSVHFLRRCRGWILKYRRDMNIRKTLIRDNEVLQSVLDRVLLSHPEVESMTKVAQELFDLAESIGSRYTGAREGKVVEGN